MSFSPQENPTKNRQEEERDLRSRLIKSFETAPLEKLYAVDNGLTEAQERLGEELEKAVKLQTENPDDLDPMIAVIDLKKRVAEAIEVQGELRSVLARRKPN